jgi:hypothetical protein
MVAGGWFVPPVGRLPAAQPIRGLPAMKRLPGMVRAPGWPSARGTTHPRATAMKAVAGGMVRAPGGPPSRGTSHPRATRDEMVAGEWFVPPGSPAVFPRHEPSAGYPRWNGSRGMVRAPGRRPFPSPDRSQAKWRNPGSSAHAVARRSLGKSRDDGCREREGQNLALPAQFPKKSNAPQLFRPDLLYPVLRDLYEDRG